MAREKVYYYNELKLYRHLESYRTLQPYRELKHYIQYFSHSHDFKNKINEYLDKAIKTTKENITCDRTKSYYLRKIDLLKKRIEGSTTSKMIINTELPEEFKSGDLIIVKNAAQLAQHYLENERCEITPDPNSKSLSLRHAFYAFLHNQEHSNLLFEALGFRNDLDDTDDIPLKIFLLTLAKPKEDDWVKINYFSKHKIIPHQKNIEALYSLLTGENTYGFFPIPDIDNPQAFIEEIKDNLEDTSTFYMCASTQVEEQALSRNLIEEYKEKALYGNKDYIADVLELFKTGTCNFIKTYELHPMLTNTEAIQPFLIECSRANINGAICAYEYIKATNDNLATQLLLNGIFLSKITDTKSYLNCLNKLIQSNFLQSPLNEKLRRKFETIENGGLVLNLHEFKQLKNETFATFKGLTSPAEENSAVEKQKTLNFKKLYYFYYNNLHIYNDLKHWYLRFKHFASEFEYSRHELYFIAEKNIKQKISCPDTQAYYLKKLKNLILTKANRHTNKIKKLKKTIQSGNLSVIKSKFDLIKTYLTKNEWLYSTQELKFKKFILYCSLHAFLNDRKYSNLLFEALELSGSRLGPDNMPLKIFLLNLAEYNDIKTHYFAEHKIIPNRTIIENLYETISAKRDELDIDNFQEFFIVVILESLINSPTPLYKVASTDIEKQELSRNLIEYQKKISTCGQHGYRYIQGIVKTLKTGICNLIEEHNLPRVPTNAEAIEPFLIEVSKISSQHAFLAYEEVKNTNERLSIKLLLNGIFLSRSNSINFKSSYYLNCLDKLIQSSFLQSPENKKLRNIFKGIFDALNILDPERFKQLEKDTFAAFDRFTSSQTPTVQIAAFP